MVWIVTNEAGMLLMHKGLIKYVDIYGEDRQFRSGFWLLTPVL
jgi:hypothetical protein